MKRPDHIDLSLRFVEPLAPDSQLHSWESPDNWLSLSEASALCTIMCHTCMHHTEHMHIYEATHTHTTFPQLLWVTCFCHCDLCLLSLGRKPELVSGYSATSATFDTHLFSFFPPSLSLMHAQTHAHIPNLSFD